jgi:hypothetical protein
MPQLRTVHHLKETVLVELISSVGGLAILHDNVPPGLPVLEQEIKSSHKGSKISCMAGSII